MMKPIVVKTSDEKTVDMTLSEFNEIIDRVYQEGFRDGEMKKDATLSPSPVESPYIHWELPQPQIIKSPWYTPDVTCEHTAFDTLENYINSIQTGETK